MHSLRNRQDGGGQHPECLRAVSAEDVAQPGSSRSQVLIQNKRPKPDEGRAGDCFRASEECLSHCQVLLLKGSFLSFTGMSNEGLRDRQVQWLYLGVPVEGRR